MDGAVAVNIVTPPASAESSIPRDITESAAPDRPVTEETTYPAVMDTSEDAPEISQAQTESLAQTPDAPAPADFPADPTASGPAESRPEITQTEEPPASPPSEDTPPTPPPPGEEEEPATWADIEEDTSAPDETELKEIESADGDYSAYEYQYWEKSFYRETDDPEYLPAEKARLTWKIKGVRGTKEKPNLAKIVRSPAAYVGGYWWTIKFFPRGNAVGALSVYLECSKQMPKPDKEMLDTEFKVVRGPPDSVLSERQPDIQVQFPRVEDSAEWFEDYKMTYTNVVRSSESADESTEKDSQPDWRVSAQIGVILYNPEEPRTGWMQSSCHQFNPHNLDWGWTNFHGPWDQIHRRQRGQRRALLRNDTLAFDAYIRVFDDPTQSLWWHSSDSEPVWNSLALTGYRPMGDSVINHSAEVAGLAAWLHLAPFRKIVQSVDVLEHLRNCDVKPRPLCDALQEFLWRIRHQSRSEQCVHTDKVTSTLRNLHEFSGDVIEFWERLRRTLELELAGTSAAGEFSRLFDNPNATLNNSSTNENSESVHSLPCQLIPSIRVPADKANTVQGAVESFLQRETNSRWSLPAVLHVDLSRQRFDHAARQWKLLYNRVDLDEVLNLTPFVPEGQCGEYDLYGFIVHRGRRTSGKFFSVLRPGGPGTKWLAFDDGSDNRVECLTRKAALEAHVGLDGSKLRDANDKTGHDVAVAVLYVRHDVVEEYLPGQMEPWDVPACLKTYYETGSYPPVHLESSDSKSEPSLQVEVYGLSSFNDKLGSLFDTYDLMSLAKQTNNVMYMALPQSTTLVELRKNIAFSKSNDAEQISPERVRLWQVGQTKNLFGPTLVFQRLSDLNDSLDNSLPLVRFWMHIVSEADAKLFAMPDPPVPVDTVEDKPEETVEVRSASDSDEERDTVPDTAGSSRDVPSSDHPEPPAPIPTAQPQQETPNPANQETPAAGDTQATVDEPASPPAEASIADVAMAEATDNDAAIATITADDVEQMEAEVTPVSETAGQTSPSEQSSESATTESAQDTIMEDSPPEPQATTVETNSDGPADDAAPAEPKVILPVPHIYYFIQIFDTEKQILRVAGSYLSRVEDNIMNAIRSHLGWAEDKDFLLWARVDGTSITSVSPADTFWTPVRDGICFIVGERLTKDERAKLGAASLFTNPDRLVQYMWASSRNHPTKAFTGTQTIDATFNGDYYSGEFNKGYYHGKGTHISDSGSTYTGDFIFGQRHGQGKMEHPSGDVYDGDWVEDQRHGQGTFIERKTGNKYVGGYKDGKRHGKGISYWEVADEEMDLCQICYSEEQDALFYDCGHVCACVTCARQVDICPICRKNVINVVKIYKM